ncbi:MAG TPA: hypothetical protein VHS03_00205 [Gaiellaceae bacterium]|nr:hypothetical protein [Gaiellaceae bacterium]
MSRKTRIRKRLLVVGLGLAAFAAPSASLAGGYSGQGLKALNAKSQAENNRYGGHDGYSYQAWQAIVAKGQAMNQRYGGQDGLSQQAYNAVVAKGEVMNQRYSSSRYGAPDGWTPYVEELTRESQGGLSPQAYNAVVAKGEAMNQRFGTNSSTLLIDGRSPDTRDAALVAQQSSVSVGDGRSPDTRDFATIAHEPVVTITKTPGFKWDDFGIGTGVALAAVLLLALSLRLLSNRQNRKPGSVATA